jgi:uncharacterized membrane protein
MIWVGADPSLGAKRVKPARTSPLSIPPVTPDASNDDLPRRLAVVDMARGAAVVAMALYHLGWDLSIFGLIAPDITREPAWQWAARVIAGSFLALSGVSLALAHRARVRWPSFLRRLGRVAGAALLITVATRPRLSGQPDPVRHSHCIACRASLVLAFPCGRPRSSSPTAAALCFLAPLG